ncbi:MAG: hypothetical protein KDB53_05955 [Planctomycetes bacterium]|nr:hypothetical protein [Planctomycetota bacterium]
MLKKMIGTVALLGVVALMAGNLCHSEEFWLARNKLKQLELTPAQAAEIARFDADFQAKFNALHNKIGCKAHQCSAEEFVAAAAGVLSNDQFRSFRGRARNRIENVGYDVRLTGQHIDNLMKLVDAL